MLVKVQEKILRDRAQTGVAMYRAARYFADLGEYLDLSLRDFFAFVSEIPYEEDWPGAEIVSRPRYILDGTLPAADCKKKAVLIAAWLVAHGYTPAADGPGKHFRFVAVSERPDGEIHHVFVQMKEAGGRWRNVDATYPGARLHAAKPEVTAGEVLE